MLVVMVAVSSIREGVTTTTIITAAPMMAATTRATTATHKVLHTTKQAPTSAVMLAVATSMVSVPVLPMLPMLLPLPHAVLEGVGGDGADGAAEHGAEGPLAELVREEPARAATHERRA